MVIKKDKHRFVVIIEKEIFTKFKSLAEEKEKRSASNLAAKMIEDYVKENSK